MEEKKYDEEKVNEEQIYVENIENNVYNPNNREDTKKYYKNIFKSHPVKASLGLIFAILYMSILAIALFSSNLILFLALFFGIIIIGILGNFISMVIENKKQERYKTFMLKNIDQLKEYKAKIVMITAKTTVETQKNKKSFGFKIYCEVNGKLYERSVDGNYSKDMEIKIYVHDKIPKFFLTEEEYLHAKM